VIRFFALACLAIFSSHDAVAASFESHPVGTVFRDAIEVGNRVTVPLPEGEWILISNTTDKTTAGRTPFYYPRLVEIRDNVIQRYIWIDNATAAPEAPGYSGAQVFFKDCRRTDMHYAKEFMNIDGGPQDCWGVNHIGMTLGNQAQPRSAAIYQYLKERKIAMPKVMVAVAYRFANARTQALTMAIYHNPEAVGFASPNSSDWRGSDWHRDRVTQDPKKQEYIAKLIEWGTSWHGRMKEGFEGKLKVPAKPSLPQP
jgi:hypothetical protein